MRTIVDPRKSSVLENFGTLHCAQNAIEIAGMKLVPDKFKAYVECHLAHAFPVVVGDNKAFHPNVLAKSYMSMWHQVFDYGHMVRAYDKENTPRDRILGSVVAVEFPQSPIGGWKVQSSRAKSPGMRAACVMCKSAEGVDRIMGQHQSGRRKWTVSLEVDYDIMVCGFAVPRECGMESGETPADMRESGFEYWSLLTAPDGLFECYNPETFEISKWKRVQPVLLMGGLSGEVSFKGIGITPLGKEPEAKVATLLAAQDVGGPLKRMASILREALLEK